MQKSGRPAGGDSEASGGRNDDETGSLRELFENNAHFLEVRSGWKTCHPQGIPASAFIVYAPSVNPEKLHSPKIITQQIAHDVLPGRL